MPLPAYLPLEPGAHRHRVGTRALDPARWVELGPDAAAQLAEKRRLLAERPHEVVAVLDGPPGPGAAAVRAAGEELLEVLAAHLLRDHATAYAPSADGGPGHLRDPRTGVPLVPGHRGLHPVDVAGRLVPEDVCLHLPGADGRLRLVAASVAFPSRWRLADKVGLPVGGIHSPVPGYAPAIGTPVDRLLEKLAPERPMWRLGGSVLDDPALFQPTGRGRARPARVPDEVWLRCERQVLVRLPRTGAVVFTIRTRVDPLAVLADQPAACAQVAGWVRGLGEGMTAYKSLAALRPDLLAWLDERAAAGAVPAARR